LLCIMRVLGPPDVPTWPALGELRHWAAVQRWPEFIELRRDFHRGGAGEREATVLKARLVQSELAHTVRPEQVDANTHTSSSQSSSRLGAELLRRLLAYDPEKRPSAEAALEDELFRGASESNPDGTAI